MKAHVTDPELIVDSVIVSFSFPKDKSKKEGSLCLVGRKEPDKKVTVVDHIVGLYALDIYRTLTGKDPYEDGENHS